MAKARAQETAFPNEEAWKEEVRRILRSPEEYNGALVKVAFAESGQHNKHAGLQTIARYVGDLAQRRSADLPAVIIKLCNEQTLHGSKKQDLFDAFGEHGFAAITKRLLQMLHDCEEGLMYSPKLSAATLASFLKNIDPQQTRQALVEITNHFSFRPGSSLDILEHFSHSYPEGLRDVKSVLEIFHGAYGKLGSFGKLESVIAKEAARLTLIAQNLISTDLAISHEARAKFKEFALSLPTAADHYFSCGTLGLARGVAAYHVFESFEKSRKPNGFDDFPLATPAFHSALLTSLLGEHTRDKLDHPDLGALWDLKYADRTRTIYDAIVSRSKQVSQEQILFKKLRAGAPAQVVDKILGVHRPNNAAATSYGQPDLKLLHTFRTCPEVMQLVTDRVLERIDEMDLREDVPDLRRILRIAKEHPHRTDMISTISKNAGHRGIIIGSHDPDKFAAILITHGAITAFGTDAAQGDSFDYEPFGNSQVNALSTLLANWQAQELAEARRARVIFDGALKRAAAQTQASFADVGRQIGGGELPAAPDVRADNMKPLPFASYGATIGVSMG